MATQTASNDTANELVMENVISTAVQIPGVKVDRNKFLTEQFASSDYPIRDILELGPVEAGVTREELSKLSYKLIFIRTGQSSLASFVAGIPGGLAMAATIPADILQFFGMALRLAQEISYLYGAKDLWIITNTARKDGDDDDFDVDKHDSTITADDDNPNGDDSKAKKKKKTKKTIVRGSSVRTGDPTSFRWAIIAMALSGFALIVVAVRRKREE